MLDLFKRNINYLRISVTDRCNLRCFYCMPEKGVKLLKQEEILSFEEITDFTRKAVSSGVRKLRLTGGEPLVRNGIVKLVTMLSEIHGIEDFGMTTNGSLLDQFAIPLKKAGLHRINISLDTMDPVRYSEITRGGKLEKVLDGVQAALSAGFSPVKINCVIINSSGEKDAMEVEKYCRKNHLEIRFIKMMDLKSGSFSIVEGGSGGDCVRCSRLRLTSNGMVKPCLFSNLQFDIKKLGYDEAILLAIRNKPKSGSINNLDHFNNLGG